MPLHPPPPNPVALRQASRCYTAALRAEPLCYEALDRLVLNHMLSTEQQQQVPHIARARIPANYCPYPRRMHKMA